MSAYSSLERHVVPATANLFVKQQQDVQSLFHPDDPVLLDGYKTTTNKRPISPIQHKKRDWIPSPTTKLLYDCHPVFDFPFSTDKERPFGPIPALLQTWTTLPKLDVLEFEHQNKVYRLYKTGELKLIKARMYQKIVQSELTYIDKKETWNYKMEFYTEVHLRDWNNFDGTYYLDTCNGLIVAGH